MFTMKSIFGFSLLGLAIGSSIQARQGCTNGPTSRRCWSDGFDIDTNQYKSWPTGKLVEKTLTIKETTCNPDGGGSSTRPCLLINDQIPGPTIFADWGDTLRITVDNQLDNNGTSIHWHGLRQLNSNIQDGTNGITECALAPHQKKTYEFKVTEYGTSWYHSHFSGQYGDGTFGTLQINGPATADYEIDLGTYALQDWYYQTAFQAGSIAMQNGQKGGAGPQANNILINGTNKSPDGSNGKYNTVTLESNKTHRLRIVNTAIDVQMRVTLDGHPFQVIATDFVPVKPYTTDYLQVGIGQRYDVIINANQTAGNYWFRAEAEGGCQSAAGGKGRAIFSYKGQTEADPATPSSTNTPTGCTNVQATPHVVLPVPKDTFASQVKALDINFQNTTLQTNGQNLVLWNINGTAMWINPGKPTVEYVAEKNTSYPHDYHVIEIPPNTDWTYWVIQQNSSPPIAHPIHLHGHDMYVLGEGDGTFNPSNTDSLNFDTPHRRDVAMIRGTGWLVIAYPADNPGAWLMHCHIAFHVSMGLSVQFLERKDEINLPPQGSEWWDTCAKYVEYQGKPPLFPQDDSGLKFF